MVSLAPIEVRRYGSGKRIVVLHGGPGAPGSAAGLARVLAAHFEVLEPLQRRSGVVPTTVAQHVDDLAVVAPIPAIVIGSSWGAMLGLSFAARFPDRVSHLVLVGCGTYDEASREILRETLAQRLGETGLRNISALQTRIASEPNATARDALLTELGEAYMQAEGYDLLDEPPPHFIADEAGHNETWNDVLRLQREGIEPAAFRAIAARVLMIHGDVDPHPGAETRDLLRRFIPTLEYTELERCGHEPWRERQARDRFVETIRAWLAR